MIRHTVVFCLKYLTGSVAEQTFLNAALELVRIPGVEHFECLRQISKKNAFTFGLSMEFADVQAYAGYCEHPEHTKFVQEHWLPGVSEFLEIDYTPME